MRRTLFLGMQRTMALRNEIFLSKATRLQLGNVKTPYGELQTAAGNQEKWGYIYRGWKYPLTAYFSISFLILLLQTINGVYLQYKDSIILSEHITYEDLKDRCLTPMPGWARLRTCRTACPGQFHTYRDPTPLEWLPFEIKLGQVKQASY